MADTVLGKAASLVVRPLGALAAGITRLQMRAYEPTDNTISDVSDTNFPTALQPVRPFGNEQTKPLGMNVQMGQNLIFTPRPDARYTSTQLQAYASYPLARICIEMIKNIVAGMPWKVQLRSQPGENRKEYEAKNEKDANIQTLTDFVQRPNPEMDFRAFTARVFEDMLVIDAGSILLIYDDDGETITQWRPIEGAYITRLVTDQGFTPEAPDPAYQQLWEGMPLVNLNTDQLVYAPRNISYRTGTISYSLYGLSPTEFLAPEIEVGIQRLAYVTAFYRDGSVPNVLWVVPPEAPPDKVNEAMKLFNSNLSGNLQQRRMAQYAQGFVAEGKDTIHQFKEPDLADNYDDLHIRKLAAGYGVSPQRLLKMMNRAASQSNQEAAEEEGIAPYLVWYTAVINEIIQKKMGFEKYEFVFDKSRDPDPKVQSDIDNADVKGGLQTINGARVGRGWDTISDPAADVLAITTLQGRVPIGQPVTPPTASGGKDKQPGATAGGGDDPNSPKPKDDQQPKPEKFAKSDNLAIIDPTRQSIRGRSATSKLQAKFSHFFHHVADNLVIVRKPVKKMRKASDDNDDTPTVDEIVDEIMNSIDWSSIPEAIEDPLADAGQDGADHGLDQVERMQQVESGKPITLSAQPVRVVTNAVISQTNQVAQDYARTRAAELVGMKWVDNKLVTNPNPKWAITDSTRTMLRDIISDAFENEAPFSELVTRIRDAGVFSDERARTIANTEVKFAQVGGNYAAWQKSGIVKSAKWLLSGNHDNDDECDDNAEAGPVDIGEAYPSGALMPPAHPNCVCSIAAVSIGGLSQKW